MTFVTPNSVAGINSISAQSETIQVFNSSGGTGTINGNFSGTLTGVSTAGITTAYINSINNGPIAGFRNLIINGNMFFSQRGTTFSTAASPATLFTGAYTLDRWLTNWDGSGSTRIVTQESLGLADAIFDENVVVSGAYLRYNQTGAGTGATFSNLLQRFEVLGRFNNKVWTLSFWARSGTGTFVLRKPLFERYFGVGGSTVDYTEFGSTSTITTTWTKFSYTITTPSLSGKTLGTGPYTSIIITLPLNQTFDLWITGIQFEPGPVATPFEQRPFGTELALCQRYYTAFQYQTGGTTASGVGFYGQVFYKQEMRTTPTLVFSSVGVVGNFDTAVPAVGSVSNTREVSFFKTATATGSGIYSFASTCSAEL